MSFRLGLGAGGGPNSELTGHTLSSPPDKDQMASSGLLVGTAYRNHSSSDYDHHTQYHQTSSTQHYQHLSNDPYHSRQYAGSTSTSNSHYDSLSSRHPHSQRGHHHRSSHAQRRLPLHTNDNKQEGKHEGSSSAVASTSQPIPKSSAFTSTTTIAKYYEMEDYPQQKSFTSSREFNESLNEVEKEVFRNHKRLEREKRKRLPLQAEKKACNQWNEQYQIRILQQQEEVLKLGRNVEDETKRKLLNVGLVTHRSPDRNSFSGEEDLVEAESFKHKQQFKTTTGSNSLSTNQSISSGGSIPKTGTIAAQLNRSFLQQELLLQRKQPRTKKQLESHTPPPPEPPLLKKKRTTKTVPMSLAVQALKASYRHDGVNSTSNTQKKTKRKRSDSVSSSLSDNQFVTLSSQELKKQRNVSLIATSLHQKFTAAAALKQQQQQQEALSISTKLFSKSELKMDPIVDSQGRTVIPLTSNEFEAIQEGKLSIPITMTLAQTPEGMPILLSPHPTSVNISMLAASSSSSTNPSTESTHYDRVMMEQQQLMHNKAVQDGEQPMLLEQELQKKLMSQWEELHTAQMLQRHALIGRANTESGMDERVAEDTLAARVARSMVAATTYRSVDPSASSAIDPAWSWQQGGRGGGGIQQKPTAAIIKEDDESEEEDNYELSPRDDRSRKNEASLKLPAMYKRKLPPTFVPSSDTVITVIQSRDFGRLPGNKLLRDLAFRYLDTYTTVSDPVQGLKSLDHHKFLTTVRQRKFRILKKLVNMVNQINAVAGFVAFDRQQNAWFEVSEDVAWQEVKNVINFCCEMRNEGYAPQVIPLQEDHEDEDDDDEPSAKCKVLSLSRGVATRKTKSDVDIFSTIQSKKLKRSSSREVIYIDNENLGAVNKVSSRSKYRCGLCGQFKTDSNGKSHNCSAKIKNIVTKTNSNGGVGGLCGKAKMARGPDCSLKKKKTCGKNGNGKNYHDFLAELENSRIKSGNDGSFNKKEMYDLDEDSHSYTGSRREKGEQEVVPSGSHTVRRAIQVVEDGRKYSATLDSGDALEKKGQKDQSDSETSYEVNGCSEQRLGTSCAKSTAKDNKKEVLAMEDIEDDDHDGEALIF